MPVTYSYLKIVSGGGGGGDNRLVNDAGDGGRGEVSFYYT
jgi:hypothetical protein